MLLVAGAVSTTPANAVPPQNCANTARNVEVTQGTQAGNHQGVRGDMWFRTSTNDCARVSSYAVLSSTGDGLVEWGWYLGWYTVCSSTYASSPRLFTVSIPNNGAFDCNTHGSLAGSAYYKLSIADGNSDTIWLAKRDGNTVTSLNVNFDKGDLVTNGERDCTCDSAFSEFKQLEFQVTGTSTWYNWSDPTGYSDNDPDYHWHYQSNTHHTIHLDH
jgi:hypothetical protein